MDVIHQMETCTSLASPGFCKPFFFCVNNFQNFLVTSFQFKSSPFIDFSKIILLAGF